MEQEKFGQFIKEIRKKHNLTQKQLADKYNVTYQAASKWENGKNMPDKALILEMSRDFGVSVEELMGGEYILKKKRNYMLIGSIITLILIGLGIGIFYFISSNKTQDFQFKTLSSSCDDFTISGTVSYNDKKSAIYITNIQYCGGEDKDKYKALECILYETDETVERRISSYKYNGEQSIKLEDFLKEVTLTVDDHEKVCKDYNDNSLYLVINATNEKNKTIQYKIPLKPNNNCN